MNVHRWFVCSSDLRSWVDLQVCSIRNCSLYTFWGGGRCKRQVKFKTKKEKNIQFTVLQIKDKKYKHSCDLFFLKSCLFERKVSLSRTRVIWFNLSIENPLNIFCPWKFIFKNLHSFFHFFSCYKVMTKDNNRYLIALHWGNERHHAWASSKLRGRSEVLTR